MGSVMVLFTYAIGYGALWWDWKSTGKCSLTRSSYQAFPGPDGKTRIEVTPLFGLGPVGLAVFALLFLFPGVNVFGALLIVLSRRFADANKGRRFSQFTVDAKGITLDSGERINRGDIAELYSSAPRKDRVVLHSGWSGGSAAYGTSVEAGGGGADGRAWSIRVEAKGQLYVLAGGMQEITANAVMHEIEKAFRRA